MAGQSTLAINLRTRGGDRARQEIASLANTVDKQAARINKRQATREDKRAKGFASSLREGAFGKIGSVAIGTAIGNAIPQAVGAFNRGIAQSFDPNLSPVEKELNLIKAGLDIIPLEGGAIPKAILEAQTQEIVGAARGTGARINQLLGPAFQGAAGLSTQEFEDRFQPQIDRLRQQFEPQERARERGSQLIAESLGSFLDELKTVSGVEETKALVTSNLDAIKRSKELQAALDRLTDAVLGRGGGVSLADISTIAGKVN